MVDDDDNYDNEDGDDETFGGYDENEDVNYDDDNEGETSGDVLTLETRVRRQPLQCDQHSTNPLCVCHHHCHHHCHHCCCCCCCPQRIF